MAAMIFVNLPVKNLEKSTKFAEALGWTINKQFTDETAASVAISDTIYVMLLTHAKFAEFTDKTIADASKTAQVMIALSQDSREAVDQLVERALKAGAKEPRPAQDLGFMLNRAFEDLDGHIWEIFHMNPAHVQPQ